MKGTEALSSSSHLSRLLTLRCNYPAQVCHYFRLPLLIGLYMRWIPPFSLRRRVVNRRGINEAQKDAPTKLPRDLERAMSAIRGAIVSLANFPQAVQSP